MKKHGALEEQQEADGPVVQTVWKGSNRRQRRLDHKISVGHIKYVGLYPKSNGKSLNSLKQRGM